MTGGGLVGVLTAHLVSDPRVQYAYTDVANNDLSGVYLLLHISRIYGRQVSFAVKSF